MAVSRLKQQAAIAAIMASSNPFDTVENFNVINSHVGNNIGKPPKHRTKQERKLRARNKAAKRARRVHRGSK